ncbi:ImmA/IrrE family metallo-endopeptidase [Arthrobacter sp. NPDC090010]|uniref:ImmA/IrrE family metallo-endopeptidase n=1 Tax=Arthrobacter sp. NPDC090010 TaxID=3363942 RepID=UPI003803BFF1
MGVRIRIGDTPGLAWGIWDPDRRLITLRPGMGPLQHEWTAYHELGHAHYEHIGRNPKQELAADRWAIRNMLTVDVVAREAEPGLTVQQLAARLNVLPRALHVFLDDLTAIEREVLRALVFDHAA